MTLLYQIAGTYRAAGMERVLANKVNWLAGQRNAAGEPLYRIIIATTDQRGQKPAFTMDSSVRMVDLDINYEENNGGSLADKLIHYPGKQKRHRKALKALIESEKPDVVISMFCNDAAFLPALVEKINRKTGSNIKTVLEIHFSRFKRLQYGRRGLWALADRILSRADLNTVKKFDRFVVLTEEDKAYWGGLPNMTVIPNARTFTTETPSSCENRTVLACGRYTHQKAFERLIEAWKSIDTTGWTLRIAGEGELACDLPANVITGPSDNMQEEYRNASIFTLTSRYEGLPMVLLEAQACGLPIVAMACKCGPRDVITDGADGFLVPEGDISAFACRLQSLMQNQPLRKSMGRAAIIASDRYDESAIMHRWTTLFEELQGSRIE